jgi:hypothetical protein
LVVASEGIFCDGKKPLEIAYRSNFSDALLNLMMTTLWLAMTLSFTGSQSNRKGWRRIVRWSKTKFLLSLLVVS